MLDAEVSESDSDEEEDRDKFDSLTDEQKITKIAEKQR